MNPKTDFVEGNTRSSLLGMSLPMIVAMFLNMAYNLVDSIWIGNLLGETALAALTASTPVILLLTAVGMGATNGVSILLSRAIGAVRRDKADQILATSLTASIAFSVAATALAELFLSGILALLQTRAETFAMARQYLSVYLIGYLAVFLFLYFTAVLRSFGNTFFQVAAMLVCTLLNAILDPIFIHCFGFLGAAVATIVSQGLSLAAMLVYLWRKKLFSFHLSCFDKRCALELFKKAVPSVVQQSLPAVSTSVLTAVVSGFGVTAVAAYGITGKLETILFYPAMSLNMVLTTIVGQCAGARRYDRAKDYLTCALLYGGGLLAVLSLLVALFSRQLTGIFLQGGGAPEIVARYFLIVGAGYLLNTVTSCFLGAINGMGRPSHGMLLMALYYLAVRVPLAVLLSKTGLGLDGVWLAVLFSHVVASAAASASGLRLLNKRRRDCMMG